MKKICFLLCLVLTGAYGQRLPDFGVNRVRVTEADRTMLIETNPINGKVKITSEKIYYWYSANAVHSTQGGFSGKPLNGFYKEFFITKNLKMEGAFKNGLKTGIWKSWTEEGKLIDWVTWKDGLKNGEFRLYDEKNKVKLIGKYRNDRYEGTVRSFDKDSTHVENYSNGKIVRKKRSFLKRMNIFNRSSAIIDTITKTN